MHDALIIGVKILLIYAWVRLLCAGFRWLMQESPRS